MARAVWTGTISFGLVTIPVRLFPATEPKDVRFHLTDERGRRVRYRRFVEAEGWPDAETSGEPVEPAAAPDEPRGPMPAAADPAPTDVDAPAGVEVDYRELLRGFETDAGDLVLMSADEIDAIRPERSRTIEIEDFVDLADIDPVYFEKSYVAAPQRGADKPYALLLRAIQRSGRIGIGRFVLRTKPHLVAIRPRDGVLGLETLFFGDEVRDARELAPGADAVEVSDRELELADALIATLETTWNPNAYADTYREELLRRLAEKTPVAHRPETDADVPPTGRAEQLMEALRASVEAAKQERRKAPSRRRPA
jgi:DNA end-binding protein Ku